MSIFNFENQTTFAFYNLFIAIYSISIIAAIALKIYKKKHNQKLIQLNHTLTNTYFWLATYGITGFILLFCRYAAIYFLSMEFFHILNFAVIAALIIPQLLTFKKLNYSKPQDLTK